MQWLRIGLGGSDAYENHPFGTAPSHWRALFYPFESAIDTVPGALVPIEASHDALSLSLRPG